MNVLSKVVTILFLAATLLLQGCASNAPVRSYETGQYLSPGPLPFTLVYPNGKLEYDYRRCGRAEGSARVKGSVIGALVGLGVGIVAGDKLGGTAGRVAPTVGVIAGGAVGGSISASQKARLCEEAYFYVLEHGQQSAPAVQPAPAQAIPAAYQQALAPVQQLPQQLGIQQAAQECANRSAGKICAPGQAWSVMNITGNQVSCACRVVTGQ